MRTLALLTCLLMLSLTTISKGQTLPHPLLTADELGEGPVYIVDVEGLIDRGLAVYLKRALEQAVDNRAAVVILHVDTFGGLVDAADAIRQLLLDSPIHTIAFIDKNAASAGALISLAANRIVMVPGASIGAATVVEGTTRKAAPDKYQSYMRAQMRATAEARGRDPRLAEAMVDPQIEIPGIIEEGKVLTLSTEEAYTYGIADTVVQSLQDLLQTLKLNDRPLIYYKASTLERLLRFLSSPLVSSILMLMMLGGLYFELQTPGVGFPGLMALLGAALFFAPHYMAGLVESWELVLFIVGVILLLIEIFVIPGFGIAGITGTSLIILSLLAGLIGNVGLQFPDLRYIAEAIWTLILTLLLFGALVYSLSRYLPSSTRFNRLVLQPSLHRESGYVASTSRSELLGKEGVTLTPLRPSGIATFEHERVNVVTAGEYIPPNTRVRVTRVQGNRIEVRAV